ncbi:thioester domain-containing protein [Saccharomonospora iraqiensis]|uniref:thioester domain-containing protein n=1 Tax=Saccharomonospora iraqiensis TaxID=52698 RepID=UPI00022E11F4|nr:thioester domain-containing protein [Saccharomonospora iraqiensis]
MNGRRASARGVSLLAAVGVAAVLGSVPASAQTEGRIDTTAGKSGYTAHLGGTSTETNLFALDLEGGNSIRAYCVEISVAVDPERSLHESPWDEFPDAESPFHENRDRISWVLHHGYPSVEVDALADTLTGAGAELHDGLSEKEAITGTQAAVWHFSDGLDLDRDDPSTGDDAADADVLALYDHLTGEANVGTGEQPTPALEITPETASGVAGEPIGPFTVATTGEITEITGELPDGVTLTDADGAELAAEDLADGSEVYLDVPTGTGAGQAEFALSATGQLDTGRLFVSEDYTKDPAQSLIVATSEETTLDASAGADWTAAPTTPPEESTTPTSSPAPTTQPSAPETTETTSVTPQANSGDLAQTGVSVLVPILVGLALLTGGATLVVLQRRRRST